MTPAPLHVPAGLNATLVLVRHGESTFIAEGRFQGRLDPPLSPLGIRQAGLVADRLARSDAANPLPIPGGPPLAIWHSPLARAAATARAIADAQGPHAAINAVEALTEIAQGDWEGLPIAEVKARFGPELAAWRRTPATNYAPGGEALVDAATRVSGALSAIVAELAATTGKVASRERDPVPGYPGAALADGTRGDPWAVLVAHDGIFRLALLTLLGVSLERFWSFPFNLCAITVVALHEGVAVLRAHNLSDHLEPLALEAHAAAEAVGDRRGAL